VGHADGLEPRSTFLIINNGGDPGGCQAPVSMKGSTAHGQDKASPARATTANNGLEISSAPFDSY
jgi:hypothetical protein